MKAIVETRWIINAYIDMYITSPSLLTDLQDTTVCAVLPTDSVCSIMWPSQLNTQSKNMELKGKITSFLFSDYFSESCYIYIHIILFFFRVLIVDWDVHHGQGVQYCFEDDPRWVFPIVICGCCLLAYSNLHIYLFNYIFLPSACSTSHGTAMNIRNSGRSLENQTTTVLAKRKEQDSI